MQHTTNCKRCHAAIHTYCHSLSEENGAWKPSWEVLSYRRSRYSDLCSACESAMGTSNYVFELLVSLEEKKRELEAVIRDLEPAYDATLDVTPERQKYLDVVAEFHAHEKEARESGKEFTPWYKFLEDRGYPFTI